MISATEYILELGLLLQLSGGDRLEQMNAQAPSLSGRLARINPRIWSVIDVAGMGQPDPRGKRQFPAASRSRAGSCEIFRLLPGAECTINEEGREFDHVWPYSLGGPTVSSNRTRLCATHNQVKSAFVLLAMDEQPEWLEALEGRLAALATAALRLGKYIN